jgi:ribosomal protein S10
VQNGPSKMTVESVQRVFSVTPLYTQQEVIKTATDPKTQKEYREFIVYRIYNRLGQIEENQQPKIDLQA